MKKILDKYESTFGVHDPTIIYDDVLGAYYMFSTDTKLKNDVGVGAQVRKSENLKDWEFLGTALDEIPAEIEAYTPPHSVWAPEVVKINDLYHMYYSVSSFGTNNSVIALATAKTCEGPWKDQGIIIGTKADEDEQNAIDANVLYDREGRLWMAYGSFFSGIYIVELNPKTGKRKDEENIGKCIASRSLNVEGAIEGPFIYYHKKQAMYYLFISYDFLGSNYNIRVARSKNIDGPYKDYLGQGMFENEKRPHANGTKIAGSYKLKEEVLWSAPGHCSIFTKEDEEYLVAHVRVDQKSYPHYLWMRKIIWLDSGWPVITSAHNIIDKSVDVSTMKASDLFEIIYFDNENMKLLTSTFDTFGSLSGEFKLYSLKLDNGRKTTGVSGISEFGQAYFGYRIREGT